MASYNNNGLITNDPTQSDEHSSGVSSKFLRTYTTFSGIDITAMFDDRNIMTLQAISVTITREKQQIWTFGSATPRSISRGKRTIVGSFITILFDREPMYELMMDPSKWYYAHRNEVNFLRNPVNAAAPVRAVNELTDGNLTGVSSFDTLTNSIATGNATTDYTIEAIPGLSNTGTVGLRGDITTQQITSLGSTSFQGIDFTAQGSALGFETVTDGTLPPGTIVDGEAVTVRRAAIYPDQMLPFDITLVAQNEIGQSAWQSINGVEIINEGSGMSTDDLQNEVQFTYIAIHREPWRPIEPNGENRMDPATSAFKINENGIQVATSYGAANAEWGPSYSADINGLQTTEENINIVGQTGL